MFLKIFSVFIISLLFIVFVGWILSGPERCYRFSYEKLNQEYTYKIDILLKSGRHKSVVLYSDISECKTFQRFLKCDENNKVQINNMFLVWRDPDGAETSVPIADVESIKYKVIKNDIQEKKK